MPAYLNPLRWSPMATLRDIIYKTLDIIPPHPELLLIPRQLLRFHASLQFLMTIVRYSQSSWPAPSTNNRRLSSEANYMPPLNRSLVERNLNFFIIRPPK